MVRFGPKEPNNRYACPDIWIIDETTINWSNISDSDAIAYDMIKQVSSQCVGVLRSSVSALTR